LFFVFSHLSKWMIHLEKVSRIFFVPGEPFKCYALYFFKDVDLRFPGCPSNHQFREAEEGVM
jgi:hypothetical protein